MAAVTPLFGAPGNVTKNAEKVDDNPTNIPATQQTKTKQPLPHILSKDLEGFSAAGMQVMTLAGVRALHLPLDLAKTASWAFKGGEVDELALRLMRGHCVFSRDWKSDLWLHLKNKQIFLSMFLCTPTHPFSKQERRSALLVSCVLAWGLECWFCALWSSCEEHPELNFFELFFQVSILLALVSIRLLLLGGGGGMHHRHTKNVLIL